MRVHTGILGVYMCIITGIAGCKGLNHIISFQWCVVKQQLNPMHIHKKKIKDRFVYRAGTTGTAMAVLVLRKKYGILTYERVATSKVSC